VSQSTAAIRVVYGGTTRGSFDKCIPGLSTYQYKHRYEKLIRRQLQSVKLLLTTNAVQYEANHYFDVCLHNSVFYDIVDHVKSTLTYCFWLWRHCVHY
jgi:hypothetical protein